MGRAATPVRMGGDPGGGGKGIDGQDRERVGRDDGEEKQGSGGEHGKGREEKADRRRMRRVLPACTPYTLHPPP